MSQRNGDRARFQINRKRKLRHRQRIRALLNTLSPARREGVATRAPDRPTAPADPSDVASPPTRSDV
jgi:hypothetical protein